MNKMNFAGLKKIILTILLLIESIALCCCVWTGFFFVGSKVSEQSLLM